MSYAFEKEAEGFVREVFLVGNPVVMWAGLLAMVSCMRGWMKRREDAFLIFFAFSSMYFSWAVIPRELGFFYYYYPASLTLGLALAYSLNTDLKGRPSAKWIGLALIAAMFFYFYPVLSGMRLLIPDALRWSWFSSWI